MLRQPSAEGELRISCASLRISCNPPVDHDQWMSSRRMTRVNTTWEWDSAGAGELI